MEIFVDATLVAPYSNEADDESDGESNLWKVMINQVPRQMLSNPDYPPRVFLHLTKGDLGKHLGTVDLGKP